jgi:hypothetical protein
MRDSADHHNDVIEVLTALVRNHAPTAPAGLTTRCGCIH